MLSTHMWSKCIQVGWINLQVIIDHHDKGYCIFAPLIYHHQGQNGRQANVFIYGEGV